MANKLRLTLLAAGFIVLQSVVVRSAAAEPSDACHTPCEASACAKAKATVAELPESDERNVYLLLVGGPAGDAVQTVPCTSDTAVSSVLGKAAWPQPIDFGRCEIALHRVTAVVNDDGLSVEAKERTLPIKWDAESGAPTAETNYPLLSGDRIIVTTPAASAAQRSNRDRRTVANPTMAPMAVPPRPAKRSLREVIEDGKVTQVMYRIEMIEDCKGCLAEYEPLRNGNRLMFADSRTLLPALRIMQKHKLIHKTASPKLVALTGHKAQLEVGGETMPGDKQSWQGIRIEVAAEQFESGLKLDLAVHASEEQRKADARTQLVIEPGQSVILQASIAQDKNTLPPKDQPAIYVVLTPEIVK